MSGYVCPINKKPCRCDPGAMNPKSQPCALAKRIGVFVRLMNSNWEGESTNAATMLRNLLQAEGVCNDFAVLVENCNGEIEAKKYSDVDLQVAFDRGVAKGRREETRKQDLPPEFYDQDGHPQWNAIALFCQKNIGRLNDWEREFISNMAGKTLYREPTPKETKHLLAIFIRLGGYYDPKVAQVPF